MRKINKLTDLATAEVSLVARGANKNRFLLFKSAEEGETIMSANKVILSDEEKKSLLQEFTFGIFKADFTGLHDVIIGLVRKHHAAHPELSYKEANSAVGRAVIRKEESGKYFIVDDMLEESKKVQPKVAEVKKEYDPRAQIFQDSIEGRVRKSGGKISYADSWDQECRENPEGYEAWRRSAVNVGPR